jgi:hypothetical protein
MPALQGGQGSYSLAQAERQTSRQPISYTIHHDESRLRSQGTLGASFDTGTEISTMRVVCLFLFFVYDSLERSKSNLFCILVTCNVQTTCNKPDTDTRLRTSSAARGTATDKEGSKHAKPRSAILVIHHVLHQSSIARVWWSHGSSLISVQ